MFEPLYLHQHFLNKTFLFSSWVDKHIFKKNMYTYMHTHQHILNFVFSSWIMQQFFNMNETVLILDLRLICKKNFQYCESTVASCLLSWPTWQVHQVQLCSSKVIHSRDRFSVWYARLAKPPFEDVELSCSL